MKDAAQDHHGVSTEATGPGSAVLLSTQQAAALLGKSERTWRSWDAAGLVPRPIRIRRSLFWHPDELRAWIRAGCPRRPQWEELLRKQRGNPGTA